MKTSILQKLIIFSFIILAGNGLIGYSVYVSNQKLRDSEIWVEHTEQVIYQLGNILSLGKDIESASRGFVLTNDSTYLAPLITAEKTVFKLISDLQQLTGDNPQQQMRVDSLYFYIQSRLSFSLKIVALRSQYGLETAISHISTKQGKLFSDKMRQIADIIQLEENSLLEQRKLANSHIATTYNRISVIMFAIMSGFTVLFIISTGLNMIKNKEKEKRAAELIITNNELDFQFNEKEKQVAANKELETFSYSVSHDLRAPLRHIGGFIDLLIKNSSTQLDATGLRYLNIISESAHEMGSLIDALLTFSRLSRTEMQRTKINSKNMVTQVLKTFHDDLSGRKIEINTTNLPDVMGDETLIHQVWVNLISNAFKYTRNKENTRIDIGGIVENENIVFHVKDNGAGFDMKYADKLFGVFQRLHKARDFEGIGIGLANVNRIITRHGGKCWAESEVDTGATFFFSLPNN